MKRRQFLRLAAAAAAPPAISPDASAQTYPTRPITIIVPFMPAGLQMRSAASWLNGCKFHWGSPSIENVAGENGSTGTGRVARAAPDGYTLSLGVWNTQVANAVTYALRYDVQNDFAPVGLLATFRG